MVNMVQQWVLQSRPDGMVDSKNFRLEQVKEKTVGDLENGQVLVRLVNISVDPYLRGRVNEGKSYLPCFKLGEPIVSGGIARVIATHPTVTNLQVGDLVQHFFKWKQVQAVPEKDLRKISTSAVPASYFLGVLGITGLSAYIPMKKFGKLTKDKNVFVSGAAGAVGSVAGLANLRTLKAVMWLEVPVPKIKSTF